MASIFGTTTPQAAQQPAVSGLQVQTSSQGEAIPIVYGATRISGNLIWYGDFQAVQQQSSAGSGGKGGAGGGGKGGGSGSGTYNYFTGVQIGLCEGQIFGVGAIYNDKAVDFASDLGFTVFSGAYPQAPWGVLSAKFPGQALGYTGVAHLDADPLSLGTSPNLPNFGIEIYGPFAGTAPASLDTLDADCSLVIADLLTNPFYGAGFPAARLGDLSTYQAYCMAAGLWISLALTSQTPVSSTLDDLSKATNSAFVWASGVLTLVPYGDEPLSANGYSFTPPSVPVFDLTDDDFLPNSNATGATGLNDDPVLMTRKRPSDALNDIKVEYLDRGNSYNPAIAEATAQAEIDLYGRRSDGTRSNHFFCDGNAARLSAQLQLQREQIRNVYQFTLGPRHVVLDCMDIVTLTDARLGLDRQWVRITEITENDDGTFSFVAEEYLQGTGHAALYQLQASTGYNQNYNAAPPNSNPPIIFAAPPAIAESGLEIWVVVSGPQGWGGAEIWISNDGDTYRRQDRSVGGSRQGVLLSGLPAAADPDTADTLTVDLSMSGGALVAGTQADADSFNTLCYVDGELLSFAGAELVGPSQYALSYLRRGAYNSPIGVHLAGSSFGRLDASIIKIPYTADQIGNPLFVKVPAFNFWGGGLQSLSAVDPIELTLPAPPPPPNVTGFSASNNGEVVAFKWDRVADNAIVGYDIRFAQLGATSWDEMTPLTESAKGTEMSNASVPTGTWLFAIRGRDVAGQLSPQLTTTALQVVTFYPSIASVDEAPGWGNLNSL